MKLLVASILFAFVFYSCQKEVEINDPGSIANQVEIDAATVANSMLPNSIIGGYRLDSAVIAIPAAGTGFNWNYANVPTTQSWSDSLKSPLNTAAYPNATYMTGLNLSLLGQTIVSNQYFQLSSSSWSDLGGYFSAPFNLSVSGYSLDIPAQANRNSPARTIVNFPVRYADSLFQNSSASYTGNVGGSYNGIQIDGPLTITTNTTVTSKNISSGWLKINGYTDSLPTIVQRYHSSTTTTLSSTNILINSLLSLLLGQLNLPASQTTESTQYYFWARNKGLVMQLDSNGEAFVRTGL